MSNVESRYYVSEELVYVTEIGRIYGCDINPPWYTDRLCMECHQGRESTISMNKTIGDKPADTVDATLRFNNPHYFGDGAMLFGTDAKGAYEYTGKT